MACTSYVERSSNVIASEVSNNTEVKTRHRRIRPKPPEVKRLIVNIVCNPTRKGSSLVKTYGIVTAEVDFAEGTSATNGATTGFILERTRFQSRRSITCQARRKNEGSM